MLCVVILLVLYLPPSLGFTAEVVKNLTKLIFDTNAYDSSLRPASNQMYPTDLKVSFDLISINKLDELEEKLVTTTYLTLQWKDEFLTWDTAGFRVKKIPLPQNAVWKPDFVLKNGFTEFRELGGPFYYVVLAFDGTIIWKPYQVFESQCSIDVTYFPFDRQMCNIQYTLLSHYTYQVTLSSLSENVRMGNYKANKAWEITSTSQNIDNSGSKSIITYTLNLKRKPGFYVENLVTPILFLGVLNILVFIIPADAGEKMSYCITVALGFIVFLTIISFELPANSDSTPYLSKYLQIQIFMGGITLVISAIQLWLCHKSEEQKVYTPLKILVKVALCKTLKVKVSCDDRIPQANERNNKNQNAEKFDDPISWNDVSSAIDFAMFLIYVFVYFISTSTIMAFLKNW
ncbi:neuronal acetylcholine receptor subunit beta-2-like [Crassostrea angulata]|uniref:neuronal acetylcholine receptor subunit beta-2-like n=1 Tax=Magallana angulata TaxID=2784310 RepID=UPI0022B1E478|nr:neuronal acetylcholine receptor subunit beta-2-like [Crassostrea angulata]